MKQEVSTKNAPEAVGPYVQGIKAGGFLFVSGQLPLDPTTGVPVEGGISVQTKRVMNNIKAIVEEAGAHLDALVNTSCCYLADIEDFPAFNNAYGEFFTGVPPSREAIEAAALAKGVRLEISAVCRLERQSAYPNPPPSRPRARRPRRPHG